MDAAARASHAAPDQHSRTLKARKIERLLGPGVLRDGAALLDIGAGSGWIAHYFARHPRHRLSVSAVDARDERVAKDGYVFRQVTGAALPFADASFGCVGSAFLLRNLADLRGGLAEMRRVTAPGGSVVALEITQPTLPGWRQAFRLYFHHVVPAVGALIAGNREAYTYLPQSVDRFVTPGELARLMEAVGLRDVRVRRVGLGTVTIHVGHVGHVGHVHSIGRVGRPSAAA